MLDDSQTNMRNDLEAVEQVREDSDLSIEFADLVKIDKKE